MAWPCITRACCINRFWTEFDKGDIAVPLVFTKYSDVAEVHHLHPQPRPQKRTGPGPVAIETQPPQHGEERAAASSQDGSSASVMRQDFKAWKVRPEPSCKPRNEYHPSATPFNNETQYQKDYKPWPIPKKGDHPWITRPSPTAAVNAQEGGQGGGGHGGKTAACEQTESGVEKSEIEEKVQEKETKETVKKPLKKEGTLERKVKGKAGEGETDGSAERKGRAAADALNRQIKEVVSTGSSYRTEFKAYKDVKPVKPIKAKSQYITVGEGGQKTNLETSYSATYRGEQVKAQPTDNKLMERRRIRSLYNEPGKELAKDKPLSRSKLKKTPTTTTSKMVKKAKEKQIAGSQSAKKKTPTTTTPTTTAPEAKPEGGVSKKSKEISNRLAESKQ